jgi:hypothetical protein
MSPIPMIPITKLSGLPAGLPARFLDAMVSMSLRVPRIVDNHITLCWYLVKKLNSRQVSRLKYEGKKKRKRRRGKKIEFFHQMISH